jgi:hypothetical protein
MNGPATIEDRCQAVRAFELFHRKPGERNGPIGHIGCEVFAHLAQTPTIFDRFVEVSPSDIARELRRSRSAISRVLADLDRAGLLVRKEAKKLTCRLVVTTEALEAYRIVEGGSGDAGE